MPLNVITLGLRETDNINQMITITIFYIINNFNVEQYDHNNHLITLTVITLCSLHSIYCQLKHDVVMSWCLILSDLNFRFNRFGNGRFFAVQSGEEVVVRQHLVQFLRRTFYAQQVNDFFRRLRTFNYF